MKIILFALCCTSCLVLNAQPNPKNYFEFKDSKKLVFVDDFDSLKAGWEFCLRNGGEAGDTCAIDDDSVNFRDGIFYMFNDCAMETELERKLDIDWNSNYEIVVVAKSLIDEGNDSTLMQGLVRWNYEDTDSGFNVVFFSGYFNEFHTHLGYDSLKGKCIGLRKQLKFARNTYQEFVRYTIRKYNDKIYIFVNGLLRGTFPCISFNGHTYQLERDAMHEMNLTI